MKYVAWGAIAGLVVAYLRVSKSNSPSKHPAFGGMG